MAISKKKKTGPRGARGRTQRSNRAPGARRASDQRLLRFRAAVDTSADMFMLVDRATMRYVDVNATACKMQGYTRAELLRMGPHDVSPVSRQVLERAYDETISSGETTLLQSHHLRKDGSRFPVEICRRAARVGGRWIIVAIVRDITQRVAAEEALRASEERFRALAGLSSDMYWEQDEEYRFTAVTGTGTKRLNIQQGRYIGKKRWEHEYLNMAVADWAGHVSTLDARLPFRDLELCRLDDDGHRLWISVSGEPVFDRSGAFKGYRGVGKDITERKEHAERIQYLATHDGLTALPNRYMFSQVLNLAIQGAQRYERAFSILFIDLDRFKVINDTLGHEAGDQLLKEMAARLAGCLRASDVVARLGGDEFVVLLSEASDPLELAQVSRKILSAIIRPAHIAGQECRVTGSIGICTFPKDGPDEQALMKNADSAMYLAKEEGKNTFQFYSDGIRTQTLERLALETSLRRGLENGEFLLHYQAKRDLRTGAITGVEALLRWQHPDLGMLSPTQFIPLAEETGLIVPIGRWVLRTACAQGVAWQREGLPPLCMAVNLSPREFADESLAAYIAAALADSGLAPRLLEVELTEGMVMHNPDRTVKILNELKSMGVRIAIDDFGVGYSSLAQIKRFSIDTLKVDRSFIRELPRSMEDRALTEAIITMGKNLSLTIVAEGVETQEQETFLREHACDQMQGFLFSRAVAPEEFAALLRRHAAAHGTEGGHP